MARRPPPSARVLTHGHDDSCRVHVRRYLQAPFLADEARAERREQDLVTFADDIVTPGVPPSLRRALEAWAVDESTPDEEIAQFIGWTVERVREHR